MVDGPQVPLPGHGYKIGSLTWVFGSYEMANNEVPQQGERF